MSAAAKPATSARPYVGAIVLIRTREAIGGQREHAAIVTLAGTDGRINAMVMPAEGLPYPVSGIAFGAPPSAAVPCWHWVRV